MVIFGYSKKEKILIYKSKNKLLNSLINCKFNIQKLAIFAVIYILHTRSLIPCKKKKKILTFKLNENENYL